MSLLKDTCRLSPAIAVARRGPVPPETSLLRDTRLCRSFTVSIVIDIPDIPESLHSQRERGRPQAPGYRIDDDSRCTLLVIHEADGSWAIRGLGAPGVRLTRERMVALAESILERAR
jgi:hypothetical protein